MAQSAAGTKPQRPKRTRFIDASVSTNLKDLLSNIDNLERSFKTKVMKPAIRIAGQIVAKQAASNVKAVASRTSYAGGTPGNSRTTGTRDKWSQSTAAKRASGNHSDLSKSIKVKSLNTVVILETLVICGRRYTSREAISRFISTQNQESTPTPVISASQRQRQSESARQELQRMGVSK